jgi:riboflavin kinase/FMN adenylyltransferase
MSASRSLDLSTQELNSQPLEPLHRVLTAIEPDHSYLTVVAFDPHPQEFFTGRPRALLTPLSEKRRQLENLGVEQLVLLPFNAELACLSPEAFVQKILVQQLAAQAISVGFNFRFGYQRAGTAMALAAIAAPYNIQVTVVPPQTYEGEQISSSAIRQALQSGNLQQANRLLGRSYSLIGTVVQGQQLGRTLGFPTANLQLPPEKFLPCQGVYSVRVESPELEQAQIGVMNLGYRPTIEGASQTIEVHLLDWSGDLYGQTLTVYLEQFLRPEQKFSSLEALKTQIQADCAAARSFLNSAA